MNKNKKNFLHPFPSRRNSVLRDRGVDKDEGPSSRICALSFIPVFTFFPFFFFVIPNDVFFPFSDGSSARGLIQQRQLVFVHGFHHEECKQQSVTGIYIASLSSV